MDRNTAKNLVNPMFRKYFLGYFFVYLFTMTQLNIIEQKGTQAVKEMRLQKLKSGYPFMINSKELSTNQCYLEYPNGIIKLVSFTSAARDFNVIRELSFTEASRLRQKYKLSLIGNA